MDSNSRRSLGLVHARRLVRGTRRRARLGRDRVRSRWLRGRWTERSIGDGRRQVLHCFGDSHARIFREVARRSLLSRTSFDVVSVRGATAMGMVNPGSQTNALPTFRAVIDGLSPSRHLVFLLGEVDCGFLFWYRSATQGLSVEEQFERSLAGYTTFLQTLLGEGREHVTVSSVPPPTIGEGASWGDWGHIRSQVTATLAERTEVAVAYNARLREWSAAAGCAFLDFEPDVLDPATGLVRPEFRITDHLDWHLAPGPLAEVVARRLRDLGYR